MKGCAGRTLRQTVSRIVRLTEGLALQERRRSSSLREFRREWLHLSVGEWLQESCAYERWPHREAPGERWQGRCVQRAVSLIQGGATRLQRVPAIELPLLLVK